MGKLVLTYCLIYGAVAIASEAAPAAERASKPVVIVEPAVIDCEVVTVYPWHTTHPRIVILRFGDGKSVVYRLGDCKTSLLPAAVVPG